MCRIPPTTSSAARCGSPLSACISKWEKMPSNTETGRTFLTGHPRRIENFAQLRLAERCLFERHIDDTTSAPNSFLRNCRALFITDVGCQRRGENWILSRELSQSVLIDDEAFKNRWKRRRGSTQQMNAAQ